MSHKISFGIIGCSSIAERSAIPAIISSNKIKLGKLGSRLTNKAKKFSQLFSCKSYGTYDDVIDDENVDVVYISLPIALQKKWMEKSIKAGKHIICEKSAVISYKDAKKIIQLAEKYNVRIFENFAYKYHPQHKRVLNYIKNLRLGNISSFNSSFGFNLKTKTAKFRLNKKLGGGCLNDVGCYCISASQMILQERPLWINCDLISDDSVFHELILFCKLTTQYGVYFYLIIDPI